MIDFAYAEPIKHCRTRRCREQAWLVIVILQDCGMRPDEVFPMRIENFIGMLIASGYLKARPRRPDASWL
jgi:hypothetical protein